MRNWKTSLISVATAFFMWVVFDPTTFAAVPILISLSKFFVVGGLAGLGLVSKDFNQTGTGSAKGDHDAAAEAIGAQVGEAMKKADVIVPPALAAPTPTEGVKQ